MITQETILKIIMIGLIIFAITNQIKIVRMIQEKEEILNADPLSYGARRYGIGECTCFISPTNSIWFNQSESKTIHIPKKIANNYEYINVTKLFK